jgi:hypothetical protein
MKHNLNVLIFTLALQALLPWRAARRSLTARCWRSRHGNRRRTALERLKAEHALYE